MSNSLGFDRREPSPDRQGPQMRGQGPVRPRRRPWRIVYWMAFGLLCTVSAGLIVGVIKTAGAVRLSSSTMAPMLQSGDVALYQRGTSGIVRGDLVVIQALGGGGVLVRRVIGLPGDRVTCCDSIGRVDVDGKALNEHYLALGTVPSQATFAVTLGPGQAWVMGDNRAVAVDSRAWGPRAMSDIAGRVIAISGSSGSTVVQTPATFTAAGLAPDGKRLALPFLLVILALIAVLAVIVQGAAGIIVWGVRRSRRGPRRKPVTPAADKQARQ